MMCDEATQVAEPVELVRVGECKRCGACCLTARMSLSKNGLAGGNIVAIRDLLRWWSLRPKAFVREGEDTIEFGIDLPCKFLVFEDGKANCLINDNKPQLCRDFPTRPVPQCPGYKFVLSDHSCAAGGALVEQSGE